jgi:hypothetical protein
MLPIAKELGWAPGTQGIIQVCVCVCMCVFSRPMVCWCLQLIPCCKPSHAPPLLPLRQHHVQSAFLWGYLATQLLGGTLADKYGGEADLGSMRQAQLQPWSRCSLAAEELLQGFCLHLHRPSARCRQAGHGRGHRLVLLGLSAAPGCRHHAVDSRCRPHAAGRAGGSLPRGIWGG